MKLREHFLFWLDSQISVGSLFWSDIRWLLWVPLWPFLFISWIWFDVVAVRQASLGIGLFLCVPWGFLIAHRRRIKRRDWVEPTRFSDKTGRC